MRHTEPSIPTGWSVYILRCSDSTLYTGITNDLSRRVDEHNGNDRLAARYTRGRRPVELVYTEVCDGRGKAAQREYAIKQMRRQTKERLIADQSQQWFEAQEHQ